VVFKALDLIHEKGEIDDLVDVYTAQIHTAKREKRSINRIALSELLERLDTLAVRLDMLLPYIKEARAEFDAPASTGPSESASANPLAKQPSLILKESSSHSTSPASSFDAPVAILAPSQSKSGWWPVMKLMESAIDVFTIISAETGLGTGTTTPEMRNDVSEISTCAASCNSGTSTRVPSSNCETPTQVSSDIDGMCAHDGCQGSAQQQPALTVDQMYRKALYKRAAAMHFQLVQEAVNAPAFTDLSEDDNARRPAPQPSPMSRLCSSDTTPEMRSYISEMSAQARSGNSEMSGEQM